MEAKAVQTKKGTLFIPVIPDGYWPDNDGWCLVCGEIVDCVEPDARGYECETCGRKAVYGIEELALRGMVA